MSIDAMVFIAFGQAPATKNSFKNHSSLSYNYSLYYSCCFKVERRYSGFSVQRYQVYQTRPLSHSKSVGTNRVINRALRKY